MSARPQAIAFSVEARPSALSSLTLVLVSTVALVLSTLLATPQPVRGAAPTSEVVNNLDIFCHPIDNGTGSAYLNVGFSPDPASTYAFFTHWPPDAVPFDDPPDLDTISWDTISLTHDTVSFDIHIGTFDENGEPTELDVAHATVSITYGETQVVDTKERNGNVTIRRVGTSTPLTATAQVETGTVGSYSFEGCSGQLEDVVETHSNPAAFASHDSSASLACDGVTNTNGDLLVLFADESKSSGSIFASIVLASGDQLIGFTQSVPNLQPPHIRLSFPLEDGVTGEPAGTASVAASLTFLGTESTLQRQADARVKIALSSYAVSGSLTTSTGVAFDLAGCSFQTLSFDRWISGPTPRIGGKAPANDAPEGALAISAGSGINEQTGGASSNPEAETSCGPIKYTVWFKVEGSGDPVTVDAAGSTFDTVIAVYTWDGTAFTEVTCNDDYPPGFFRTLQSQVTFDTVAGATYYIQAAGFDAEIFGFSPQVGRLRLSIN